MRAALYARLRVEVVVCDGCPVSEARLIAVYKQPMVNDVAC